MHIISETMMRKFWFKHPDSKTSLRTWYKITETVQWSNLAEVKKTFPSADIVGNFTVFNIGGNKYRLITYIDYEFKKVFIRYILTHKDYDKDQWKNDPWYK
jgi:mRNA interferase HigB